VVLPTFAEQTTQLYIGGKCKLCNFH